MITNPKSLVDMGANTAIMAAFTIPGSGPAIAAGIAAGVFLFDLFFELPDRTDPGTMTPTRTDLTNAINELKQFISDANFNTLMSQYQAQITTLNDQLSDVWIMASTGDTVKDRARRGPLFQSNVSQAQVSSWLTQIEGYKNTIVGSDPALLNVINWIEADVSHTTRTLGLYTLAAGLWINFCKLNIAFEFIVAMRDYDALKAKYDNELNDFTSAHNVWKLVGQANGDPEPLAPVPPLKPTEDDDFFNGSIFADKAKIYVDRFIAYVEPKVKTLRSSYDSRASDFKSRLDAITLGGSGSSWFYMDSKTGKTSTPQKYKQLADAQMQAYRGAVQASLWPRLTTQYDLTGVEDADIVTLQGIVDDWKKVSNDVFAPK